MEKLAKISKDILKLEIDNMSSILKESEAADISAEILKDIVEYNPNLINVYLTYSKKGLDLHGYFRYNTNESEIEVKSFQISKEANHFFVFRHMFQQVYNVLYYYDIPNNQLITSWLHNKDEKSISIHETFNFEKIETNGVYIKYKTTAKNIIDRLSDMGFKNRFTSYSHPGLMPIRVLQYNLTYNIENFRSSRSSELREMIADGKISNAIKYKINNDQFLPIKVDPKKNQIIIEEQFLAYLWSFIYSTFVIHEEGIQIPSISNNNIFTGKIEISRDITKRAFNLFEWSIHLPKGYNPWPLNLPNPELSHNAEEQFYSEKINGIFQDTVTFFVNHEIAHLINNHWNVLEAIKIKKDVDRTPEEKQLYQEIESDADAYARETMINLAQDDDGKLLQGISVLYASLTSFFMLNHPSGLSDNLHPDVDVRLSHTIEYLSLQKDHNIDYVYMLGFMILHYLFIHWKEELALVSLDYNFPTDFSNPKDCFNHALAFIDTIKERYAELDAQ